MIWRAIRHDLVIYLGVDRDDWLLDENTFAAYTNLNNMPENSYIKKNILYSRYEQKELSSPHSIQDLIDKKMVIVNG